MMMPFQKMAAVSPACYEDNDKDEDAQPLHAQRARMRKWDRLKDAEEYLIEMACDQGAAVKEELT